MVIYIDDYYNNINNYKYKIKNIEPLKNIIYEILKKNNISYLPIKLLYGIIFLYKYNLNFNKINYIIYNKIFFKKQINISKIFNYIYYKKWFYLINISIYNNVESDFIDYFLSLYKLYIEKESVPYIYILQAKHILKVKILKFKQLKFYFLKDIYYTLYFIPIIFSKISKTYLNFENIFNIDNNYDSN